MVTTNPYESPKSQSESGPGSTTKPVIPGCLSYLGAYLAGIVTCVLLTSFSGFIHDLWPWYPLIAPIGYGLFYFELSPTHTLGHGTAHWFTFVLGLMPFLCEIAVRAMAFSRIQPLRPIWIAFPIGFVGTVGMM